MCYVVRFRLKDILVAFSFQKLGRDEVFKRKFQGVFSDQKICKDCPHRSVCRCHNMFGANKIKMIHFSDEDVRKNFDKP